MPRKDTVTTLDMGSRKVTVFFSLQSNPWYWQVTFGLACCSVALSQAGAIIWTGAPVTSGSRLRGRALARPLRGLRLVQARNTDKDLPSEQPASGTLMAKIPRLRSAVDRGIQRSAGSQVHVDREFASETGGL